MVELIQKNPAPSDSPSEALPAWPCSWGRPRHTPSLADEKRPKEAAPLVHVHGGGVGHRHKQAVAAAEREQPPLVGGVQ